MTLVQKSRQASPRGLFHEQSEIRSGLQVRNSHLITWRSREGSFEPPTFGLGSRCSILKKLLERRSSECVSAFTEELLGHSVERVASQTRLSSAGSKTLISLASSKPYLQVKVQSSRESGALENGFGSKPRSKVQRSVSGCCKFLAFSRGKIATESRSRRDGGGGSVRLNSAIITQYQSVMNWPLFVPPNLPAN